MNVDSSSRQAPPSGNLPLSGLSGYSDRHKSVVATLVKGNY